jgi:hypothetical protein
MENTPVPRRKALGAAFALGATALGAGVVCGGVRAQDPAVRIPKPAANYQDKPAANGDKCATCYLFQAPAACKVVQGEVGPEGWCRLFEAGM